MSWIHQESNIEPQQVKHKPCGFIMVYTVTQLAGSWLENIVRIMSQPLNERGREVGDL